MNTDVITVDPSSPFAARSTKEVVKQIADALEHSGHAEIRSNNDTLLGKVKVSDDGRTYLISGKKLRNRAGVQFTPGDTIKHVRDIAAVCISILVFGQIIPISAVTPMGMSFAPQTKNQPQGALAFKLVKQKDLSKKK